MKLPKITAHRLPYDRGTWRPSIEKYWSGKLVYIQMWNFQITLDYRGGPQGIMNDLMGKGPTKSPERGNNGGYMQRDELDRHIANNGRTEIDLYEEPPGEWVRLADSKPAGLTPRGQQMPDTKKEWKYMAELYAQQIEADKLTIARLKQRINKLEQKR